MNRFCEISDTDLLSRLSYFSACEPEAQQVIAAKWHRICGWREGRNLFDFNDPTDRIFVVVSGVVELASRNRGAMWHFGAGSVLGDDALLTGASHQYSAIARTPCHLLVLGEWYRTLAQKFPGVQSNIYNHAQLRRNASADFYDKLLRLGKPGRVALALLNIAYAIEQPQIVKDDAIRFPLTVDWWATQDQISDLLFVCRPKVREALEILHKAGALEFSDWSKKQNALPIVLREGCIERLERILGTM